MAVILLVVWGLIMVYSATFHLRSDQAYFLKLQLVWVMAGSIGLLITSQVDYRLWRRWALPIMGLSTISLVAVLLVGKRVSDTHMWFGNGSIQPSELAKLCFIIYIAAWLASKGEKVRDVTYGLIPFSVLLGIVTALILLQPDRGAALLIVAIALSMFFVSGAELSQLLISLLIGGAVLFLVLMRSDYAVQRLLIWFRPGSDPQGAIFQIRGMLSALSAGGLTGRGLGASTQKFIPPFVYHTDTILSVIGEELGLLGCLGVMGLFLFIAYRGLLIAFHAPDGFSQLLAFGITVWITVQATVHIGGNTGALPFTGITLPFVSYGGSSLTACLAGVGVLLGISRVTVERKVPSAAFAFGRWHRRPRLSRTRRSARTAKRR
jgi:cell division protein FtsW